MAHIRLATGDVLRIPRVDQQHFESARLKNLKHGNPVHARRLHGDRRNADRVEPIRQLVQIAAEGVEGPYRPFVSLAGHCHHVEPRTDVNASGIGVNRR
jgi:hypothetical protein